MKIIVIFTRKHKKLKLKTRKMFEFLKKKDFFAGVGKKNRRNRKKSKSIAKNEKNSLEHQKFKRVSLGGELYY